MSAPPEPTETLDPVLAAEAAHLADSREALARMRAETMSLKAQSGDWVSAAILHSTLRKRAESLRDNARVPLFFGRLDYSEHVTAGGADAPTAEGHETRSADAATDVSPFAGERYYIGRRHVHDSGGDPLVVDWRAPVSLPFYRANRNEPMGVALRRRFGFSSGALTAYEDESFATDAAVDAVAVDAATTGMVPEPAAPDGAAAAIAGSRIMTAEIERPRTGPMRDIVSTIQPEQDEIVRTDLAVSLCVQGAPGTGKTAVGLHRVAFLLYAFRERLRRGGVLVIGPNREFLRYIEQVLPALGEVGVAQATLDQLVDRVAVTGLDEPETARLKGDPRLAEVLSRALWSRLRPAREAVPDGLLVPRGSRRWRVPSYELDELVDSLRARDVRYGAGRAMLSQRIAHAVLMRMEASGDSPDDRVQDAVARSRPVKAAVDALWPAVDPARLVFDLLSDPALLAASSEGLLDDAERAAIAWESTLPRIPRGPRQARWTLADAVLVDEAADLLERTPSLGHVVLDEAQDLSPMQCRAVGRRCSTGSVTVLGDIAQGTTPWATDGWRTTLYHLGKPEALLEELTQGFRVPRQIIDFAARLLPSAAPGLEPPSSVRQTPGSLVIHRAAGTAGAEADAAAFCREALGYDGSIGLIAADARVEALAAALDHAGLAHTVLGRDEPAGDGIDEAETTGGTDESAEAAAVARALAEAADEERERLTVVPASLAKGLEYDQVLVVEPAEIVAAEPRGLRRLYVVLTRAVSRLVVVHAEPLPDALLD